MSEQVKPAEAFKVWRNPARPGEPIQYMGDFYPPPGQEYFTIADLFELGFAPGAYTFRTPDSARDSGWPKWITVRISGD
jgi:hypothetical protein